MSINVLPDEALLAIFDFCSGRYQVRKEDIKLWQILVHVCRRWRSIVFGSPRRLNLRLFGTSNTPVRDMLDVWPALRLVISDYDCLSEGLDNIIALLEHSDRVCQIELEFTSSLQVVLATMQVPFPELTRLSLHSCIEMVSVLPDSLLGGSAPRLRYLSLGHFLFPALPKLLSSATHLVDLHLSDIPPSAYISPETMVTLISTLTSLESLILEFQSRQSQAGRRLPPPIRSVLSALTSFLFKGAGEYIDDLVARIDAPRLNSLYINFIDQSEFDTPQLIEFICRTPGLNALKDAHVAFNDLAWIYLSSGCRELCVKILCGKLYGQLSSLGKVCTSCLPSLSALENLYILEVPKWQPSRWNENMQYDIEDDMLWSELLRPFTGVKNLYVSEGMAQRVVPELQELVGVLPTLENIFLEELQPSGPVQKDIKKFIDTQQVRRHPIAVSLWDGQPSSLKHFR